MVLEFPVWCTKINHNDERKFCMSSEFSFYKFVNLQSQKSSRYFWKYFWKYFCLKNIDLGKQPESCEEKHISKSNEQFQLQNNEISTANISHLYSCNLHTTQLISH